MFLQSTIINRQHEIRDTVCISVTFFGLSTDVFLADLDLTYSDKTIIEEGKKLSDRHMHATHKLLSAEFPNLEGLQSTLLAETGGFLPVNGTAGDFFLEGDWHIIILLY